MNTLKTSNIALLLACALAGNMSSAFAGRLIKHSKAIPASPVRFAVVSDPHLYNARLGTSGSAFEAYLDHDQKMLRESEAILESALAEVADAGVQFLIIPGDLSKDGEILNHVLMAKHLQKLEKSGVEVFVVPGNHDINNPDAVRYRGDATRKVANTSPKTFRALYQQFGYGQAIERDSSSLSYLAEPVPGLWLLAIDSCKYQDNLALGTPVIGGRISPMTMSWVLAVLQEAQRQGKQVIAFMHHGVNQHFLSEPALFADYLLDDWSTVSDQLAEAGLKAVFTGHYHSQDAAWPLDDALNPQMTLCDIQTDSLVQYPCAFRIVTVNGDSLNIESHRIQQINADTGGLPFQEFADAFLRTHMSPYVIQQLMLLLGFSLAEATEQAPFVIDTLIANYAGDEVLSPEVQAKLQELLTSPDSRKQQLGTLLAGVWFEWDPHDNNLVVGF